MRLAWKKSAIQPIVSAISQCIGGLEMETLAGFLTFDQETHLAIQGPEFYPVQFYQLWEGERIQIEPNRFATGDSRYHPGWTWGSQGRTRPATAV